MLMLATFVLVLATLVVSFAFVAFFVLAALVMFALRFWHVGLHFLHLLCHLDEFCSLVFVKVVPVGESLNHLVHASHHFRAWSLIVVVTLMMLFALLFLIFAAFFLFAIFFVFLFVAA